MNTLDPSQLTARIIACAIEVHRHLGPGLLERTYERALCIELELAGLAYARQVAFPVVYKGELIGTYCMDLIVEEQVVLEIKSVQLLNPVNEAQVLSYLKVSGLKVGLLLNFNSQPGFMTWGLEDLPKEWRSHTGLDPPATVICSAAGQSVSVSRSSSRKRRLRDFWGHSTP